MEMRHTKTTSEQSQDPRRAMGMCRAYGAPLRLLRSGTQPLRAGLNCGAPLALWGNRKHIMAGLAQRSDDRAGAAFVG